MLPCGGHDKALRRDLVSSCSLDHGLNRRFDWRRSSPYRMMNGDHILGLYIKTPFIVKWVNCCIPLPKEPEPST